jgi:hypothetical protein
MYKLNGVAYAGSTHDSGSCRLGSIPSTPTKKKLGKFPKLPTVKILTDFAVCGLGD